MVCQKIAYCDFRNIEKAELTFSDTVNVFIGQNAQGKTSAIEGIYLFARGKSFRSNHDSEMIRFGSEYSSVDMSFRNADRNFDMRIAYSNTGKRLCRRNGVDIKKLSEFIGYFRAVVFCPSHLSLVEDGPAKRRSFLDCAISQIFPSYVVSLQRYSNILSQRNALIKSAFFDRNAFDSTIEYWSAQLAHEAAAISKKRACYIEKLSKYSNAFISDMTGGRETLSLIYSEQKSEEEYMRELMSSHEREIKYGATLYGVHKDDIQIELCQKEARSFASQGQKRSIALAMKLSEGEISKDECGEYPVFLLDDVLSELDSVRREYVISGIGGRQTFITSCDNTGLSELKGGKSFTVVNGSFSEI